MRECVGERECGGSEGGERKEVRDVVLFFDTETTGLVVQSRKGAREYPRLVQVAALLVDEAGEVCGQMDAVMRPVGFSIPLRATAIHGITTERAARCGVEVRSALSLFGELARSARLVVAHNVQFDADIIAAEYERLGLRNWLQGRERFCTMRAAAQELARREGVRGRKWPTLAEAHRALLGKDFEGAHRAMADVLACRRCYDELRRPAAAVARQLTIPTDRADPYPELDAILE